MKALSQRSNPFRKKQSLRGARLADSTDLSIAFDKILHVTSSARAHGVSPSTAQTARVCVAEVARQEILECIRGWTRHCESDRPSAVLQVRKWDEATSRLQTPMEVPGVGELRGGAAVRGQCIMQSKRIVVLVWPHRTVVLFIPCYPIPMASTTAECVHAAMDNSEQYADVLAELAKLAATSRFNPKFDVRDYGL